MKRLVLLVMLMGLLALPLAAQTTTGTIDGRVIDENAQTLPGVTVEATSPNLQGTKTAVTDTEGRFRLVLLPPGTYSVRFSLSGFSTVEHHDVKVNLGRNVALAVEMRSAFKEEVVVSGAAPTIDVKSTEIGSNVDSKVFNSIPLGRNYAAVVNTTPGATNQDAAGTMVYGSTGSENAYYIDGINTTGVELGQQGKTLNFEFIQEVQVKTGGYQAEFGRATGGLINVITKSGGNEFHGNVFGYYDSDSLQSSVSDDVKYYREVGSGSFYEEGFTRKDYGADLGGFFLKDRIWFFAAYDRVDNDRQEVVAKDFSPYGGPTKGKVYTTTTERDLWSAKLTFRISDAHSLIVSGFGDPTTNDGNAGGRALSGPETTFLETVDEGGTDAVLKYEGVLGTSLVINAQAAQHRETYKESGAGASIKQIRDYTTPLYYNTATVTRSGGLDLMNNDEFGRDSYKADVSYFLSGFGGDHEFKLGGDYEKITVDAGRYHSGGDRVQKRCVSGHWMFDDDDNALGCDPAWVYYRHEFYMSARPPGGETDPNMAAYVLEPMTVDSKSDGFAVFLQDTWRLTPNLSMNLGVRWEQQRLYDGKGNVSANLTNQWAPRVGFIWDFKGDGTSKLYGSGSRFYEAIPMDMVIRAFGGEITSLFSNNSTTDLFCDRPAGTPAAGQICRIVGKEATPVLKGTKGQYVDEYVLGAEYEVMKDLAVGAKYIYRTLPRVVEDGLGADQGYYIGNPGYGEMKLFWDQNYEVQYAFSEPKRYFKGVELTARKRFTNNWQMTASYLYSKLEGNYDGTFQASTGQLDPNLNSAFDYAEFMVNARGYLSNDRRHNFRVDGFYNFNFGLNVGLSASYRTGVPVTAMGYNDAYRNFELYLSQRGDWDRTDNEYEMDMHLGYPLKLGAVEINFLVDVFNLLNRQGETDRDNNYTTQGEGFSTINYETATINPPIPKGSNCAAIAEDPDMCNDAFNTSNDWQDPRQIRFGIRVTF